jgi:acyl-CoA synthetase (AMP-forming)/AMP-acid ligase II
LTTFQAALCLNPTNVNNLKQVGRSLYLLGKHNTALEVFDEAEKLISKALLENFALASSFFCFSIPDNGLGSCLAICFVMPVSFSKGQIVNLLKLSLPKYWCPKRFFYSNHFPTTQSGKPIRRAVDTTQFTELL